MKYLRRPLGITERKTIQKERWENYEPAAFIQLSKNNNRAIQEFPFPRSGKYILVKLIRSEGNDNIDCQFIGFQGFFAKQSFPHGSIL